MAKYQCPCDEPKCRGNRGKFYVTVMDHDRKGFLLGPYADHATALANVSRGTTLANNADPRSHWYAFGTASTPKNVATITTVFGA